MRFSRKLTRRIDRRWLKKHYPVLATLGLLTVVVTAMLATLLGAGVVSRTLNVGDGYIWFWSSAGGEAQRVNVSSGQVDVRYKLTDASGRKVSLSETDKSLVLHDPERGSVTTVDLQTLTNEAQAQLRPGAGIEFTSWGNVLLLLDTTEGSIRKVDPASLSNVGKPLALGSNVIKGGFDERGTYWCFADGKALGIQADEDTEDPRVVRDVDVSAPDRDVVVTVLNRGVAVLDSGGDTVSVIDDDEKTVTGVPGLEEPKVAARTTGSVIAITQPNARSVLLVEDGEVRTIGVPGQGSLGEARVYSDLIYLVDLSADQIIVLDMSGNITERLPVTGGSDELTLAEREGKLVADSPQGSSVMLLDRGENPIVVEKVPGSGDKPGPDGGTPSDRPNPLRPEPRRSQSPDEFRAPQTPRGDLPADVRPSPREREPQPEPAPSEPAAPSTRPPARPQPQPAPQPQPQPAPQPRPPSPPPPQPAPQPQPVQPVQPAIPGMPGGPPVPGMPGGPPIPGMPGW